MKVLPTPTTRDHKDHTIRREPHRPDDTDTLARALTDVPCALLPTPAVNDMGAAYTPETWDAWTDRMKAKHGNGNGHGKSLNIEAQRLLQTPSVADALGGHERRGGKRSDELLLNGQVKELARLLPTPTVQHSARNSTAGRSPDAKPFSLGDTLGDIVYADRWGDYGPAIARWEHINGPAPEPTTISTKGNPQLSAAFTEWLMGLPAGWITDVPGVTRNEALKMCGNGVVPQQGAAALRWMLTQMEVAA